MAKGWSDCDSGSSLRRATKTTESFAQNNEAAKVLAAGLSNK